MKFDARFDHTSPAQLRLPRRLLAFITVGTLALGFAPNTLAVTIKPQRPAPTAPVVTAPTAPNSVINATPTTRERRAQAYAKLLEGQRYLSAARGAGGITRDGLRSAQQAFQQAATLDPTLAEAHTALAEVAFYFQNDTEQAEREAVVAAKIDANNFGAHRILSRLYALKAGLDSDKLDRAAADRAIAELREVARLSDNDAEAYALLGELYQLTGLEREAIEAFTRGAAAPTGVDARFYQVISQGGELTPDAAAARLAEAQLHAGHADEAVTAIRRALSVNPENARALELLEQAADAGGDTRAAIGDLERTANASPDNADAVRLLARLLARSNRVDEAVARLRATAAKPVASGKNGGRFLLQLELARILADALRYDEAVAAYDEALKARGIGNTRLAAETDKQLARTLLGNIVELQRLSGKADAARQTIERMGLLLGADDPETVRQSVALLRTQGKRQEVLDVIRAARAKNPEQTAFLPLEATALAELGRVDEGAALWRTLLTGKPETDISAQLNLAQLYIEAGRGAEGVAEARKALALVPPGQPGISATALAVLASAQERAGDPKGAEESLRRVLTTDPNNRTALNNLGYFLVERNERLPEALSLIQRAVKAEPTNPSFLDSLGWAYFKLNRLDEAERHLNEAARRNNDSVAIHEHLGDLYQRRGKPEQARVAWQKALALSAEAGDTSRLKAKLSGKTSK